MTNVPPAVKFSTANFNACKVNWDCVKASWTQPRPTLGAPSCNTVSAFQVFIWPRNRLRQSSVVISDWNVITLGNGLIGTISTPIINELIGHNCDATWHHEPGAAHKSMTTLDFSKKWPYFSLIWMILNDERALYPFSLAR